MIQNCPKWRSQTPVDRSASTIGLGMLDSSLKTHDGQSFTDAILGKCQYESFYLTNELYGGYSYKCERGFSSVSYADPQEVIAIARKAGFTKIHLAGEIWAEVGRTGWGEEVSLEEAERLLEELKRKRF